MKKLMLLLSFLVLLTNFVFSQSLPTVVDNSKWFPPVRSQENIGNCTHFSAIYYLKSAIWNKKFNRDPKLAVNQFNENFVWNQNSHPIYGVSDVESAFNFMQTQGCATMVDFPANEQDASIKPTFAVREKALTYKSKRLFAGMFFGSRNGNIDVTKHINMLKDSLNQGKCFTLGIQLFRYFDKMTVKKNVYNCYPGISHDSVYYNHMFTIVGYNDTIKTAGGRGAFQVINSNSRVAEGKFYLDYNWFHLDQQQSYNYYFLEEDFSSQPQIAVNIKLSGNVLSKDVSDYKSCFADVAVDYVGKKVDFINFLDYLSGANQTQVMSINGRHLNMREKTFVRPFNSLDGNFELVSDLTNLSSAADFKSASVVVFDPISVNYVGADNQSFYSYTRESKLNVETAYISFVGTGKKLIAKVTNLSDTTIVVNNFYSVVAGLNLQPFNENIFVKSCTSILKRKLITFTIADLQTNTAPVFTQVPSSSLAVNKNEVASFTFKAKDAESNPITYSISSGAGASINSATGLFQYQTSSVGTFSFTVKASDGLADTSTSFDVKVTAVQTNEAPIFYSRAENGFSVFKGDVISYEFKANDPENAAIVYAIVSGTGATLNSVTGMFEYRTVDSGTFLFKVSASDGVNIVNSEFSIIVKLNNTPLFTSTPSDQTLLPGNTFKYKFVASDQEGDKLKFAVSEGANASIDPDSGDFTYTAATSGTFTFKITVSDYHSVGTFTFKIKVEGVVINTPPVFTQVPAGDLVITLGQIASFTFKASDVEGSPITYSIGGGLGASIDAVTGLFKYQPSEAGRFVYRIDASDGVNIVSTIVNVKADAPANNAPTFVNLPGTLKAYVNKNFTYQFEATDKDGDNLTFSILNPLTEAQMSSDGKLTFKGTKVMTYRFTVVVSDSKASTNEAVAISVDISDDVEEVVEPDYSVSIYPNPVVDNMNIEIISKKSKSVNMTIYDLQGRSIVTVINECSAGENTFNYEAATLKSGVYICKFAAGNTVLQTIKIIKK